MRTESGHSHHDSGAGFECGGKRGGSVLTRFRGKSRSVRCA